MRVREARAMLEGLDKIDWASTHHAYGPARDVPGLLRQLLSADDAEREAASYELYGNIWHQGTIYEATALAVPFLFELALDPATPDREVVAVLLGLIARGKAGDGEHGDVGATTRAAMGAEIASAVALVRSIETEPPLALAAVHLLASHGDAHAEIVPALRDLLQRTSGPRARATVALALAVLGDRQPAAFVATGDDRELIARLGTLAGAVENFDRDFVLDMVLDLATGEFDESALNGLGV
jgi:hypothetical protein